MPATQIARLSEMLTARMEETLTASVCTRLVATLISTLIAALSATLGSTPAHAETAAQSQQAFLSRQYDWVMTCHVNDHPNYLNHETSKLKGLVTVAVDYQPTTTGLAEMKTPPAPCAFEEFWYSQGKCVGLRRKANVPLPNFWQGVIFFPDDGTANMSMRALEMANSTARLLIDVSATKALVSSVVVPNKCFGAVVGSLSNLNFRPMESAPTGTGKNISLHILGYPAQEDVYLFHVQSFSSTK